MYWYSYLDVKEKTLSASAGPWLRYWLFRPTTSSSILDVLGSVHHSIIHIENPTRCNCVSKFYFIYIYIWSSTCFGRHTAHHQEPKLHWQPLVLHTWRVVGHVVAVRCQVEYERVHPLILYLTASGNCTSNNPPRMQNQRLLVPF